MKYVICEYCYNEFRPRETWSNEYGVYCECPYCGADVEISGEDCYDLDEGFEDQSEDW